MSSGDNVQQVDYSGVQSGFQNLAGTFGKYMGEAYDWAKGQWQKQEPYSDEVQQIMLDQAHAGADWAQADRQRWEETYKPVEDAYVQQAINYDTPGRREAEAGRYAAQASAAAEQAGDEAKRQLTTFGVKPTDVRMGALDTGVRMTKAANAVGASESARRNVENTGLALKQGVIQQGNQYPGRAIANANMGQAAGTAGTNIGVATDTAYGGLMGTAPQWGGLNVSALQGWNTSLTDQQKAEIATKEANQSSGGVGKLAGTLIGGAAGAYFGGPMGASVGANIGGQAGGMTGLAEGGPVDITKIGGHVPYEMSPSGGAQTDDINAVIPGVGGGPPQQAQIDAGEFIFPERTTKYYGTKHLQGLIDKADKAMTQQGPPGPPQGATPQPGPPPPGVIPMPGYADGGGVEITRGASTQLNPDTFAPVERSWRDRGRDAVRGMAAMNSGAAAAPAQKSALGIYTRWGAAEGGVVPADPYDPYDKLAVAVDKSTGQTMVENSQAQAEQDEREFQDQMYRHAIDSATYRSRMDDGFAALDYAAAAPDVSGFIDRANQRDPGYMFKHPSYEQLAADKDLRRGRTRTAPRDGYAEGGVVDTRPFEAKDLSVPIGKGRLSGRGSYERDVLEGEVGYDYPVNDRTTLGVRGNASKYIGPHGDMERPEWGVGVRGRVKFKDGGPVMPLIGTASKAANYLFGEREQDPMRSWDMDPLPGEFPTEEDAREQRLYNIRHGDQRDNITNTTRMSREAGSPEAIAEDLNSDRIFKQPTPATPIGWDHADQMMRAKMGAGQSGVGVLGFDPGVMSYTPNAGLTAGGMYDPTTGRIWVDTKYPTTPAHESIHRGHAAVGRDPEGAKLMSGYSRHGREILTRGDMLRRFGDVEKGRGDLADEQVEEARKRLRDPEWRKKMRDIDRVGHRLNAERIVEKQGGVSGAYARGGTVRRR